jgi:hypothetical protein
VSGGDQSLRKIVGLMTDDQIEWASTSESAFDVAKFGQQPPPDDDEDAAVSPTAKTGFSVGMVAGKEALQAELCRRFPAEKPALAAYFAAVAAVSSGVKPYAVLKLLPLWVASRLQSVLPFTRYSKQTTAQVLAACGCSQAGGRALVHLGRLRAAPSPVVLRGARARGQPLLQRRPLSGRRARAHRAAHREHTRPPISLSRTVARTHMYTYAAKVWDLSIDSSASFCRPVPNLRVTIRNFSHRDIGGGAGAARQPCVRARRRGRDSSRRHGHKSHRRARERRAHRVGQRGALPPPQPGECRFSNSAGRERSLS